MIHGSGHHCLCIGMGVTSDMTKRIIATNGCRNAFIYSKSYTKGQHMTAQSVPNCNKDCILHLPQFYHNYWFVSHSDERNLLHQEPWVLFIQTNHSGQIIITKPTRRFQKSIKFDIKSGKQPRDNTRRRNLQNGTLDFPPKIFGGFSLPKPLPFAASNPVLGRSRVHTLGCPYRSRAPPHRSLPYYWPSRGVGGPRVPCRGLPIPPLRKKGWIRKPMVPLK